MEALGLSMKEEWGWVVRWAWWMLRSDSIEDAIYVLLCIPWADQSPPVAAGSSLVP